MSGHPTLPTLSNAGTSRLARRAALRAAALAPVAYVLGSQPLHASDTPAAVPDKKRAVVCVFLRGAADGLNIVVPHGDPEYYRARRSIAVPRPGAAGGAVDLDGFFGLHPKLAGLKAAYDARELLLIHAVGSPHPTRSHFEAQAYMETGAVGESSAASGWLAQYLSRQGREESGRVRAVALSSRSPLSLRGYAPAVVTPSLAEFGLSASEELAPVLRSGFARLYGAASRQLAGVSGQRALEADALLRRLLSSRYRPEHGATYRREARAFADVARLLKADVGLEVAWIDVGGWDTHRQQGASERGELPRSLEQLGRALGAFRTDLGPRFEQVVVLVMTEFGRTVAENGTGGTDHGHGSAMLVLGGSVNGGRVAGQFPGLAPDVLHHGRDLAVTTDFRDVLCELIEQHMGWADARRLFAGHSRSSSPLLGLLR